MVLKKKKKASLLVEFIAILPFMVFCVWAVANVMFLMNAQSTLHQAAIMSAEVISQEMRGAVKGTDTILENPTMQANIKLNVLKTIQNTTKYNSLVDLGKIVEESDIQIASGSSSCNDPSTSDAKLSRPYICIKTESSGKSSVNVNNTTATTGIVGQGHDIITVTIKANFNGFGGYKGIFFKNTKVKGFGYSALDQAERFNYQTQ